MSSRTADEWRAVMAALEAIAHNPKETPERRNKARAAIRNATRPSGSLGSTLAAYQGGGQQRHTSGGSAQSMTEGELEGWARHRG